MCNSNSLHISEHPCPNCQRTTLAICQECGAYKCISCKYITGKPVAELKAKVKSDALKEYLRTNKNWKAHPITTPIQADDIAVRVAQILHKTSNYSDVEAVDNLINKADYGMFNSIRQIFMEVLDKAFAVKMNFEEEVQVDREQEAMTKGVLVGLGACAEAFRQAHAHNEYLK